MVRQAVLEHVGRVSGVVRRTPLRAFRSDRTVVIGLNLRAEPMPAWFRWGLRQVARTVDCVELPILSTEPARA